MAKIAAKPPSAQLKRTAQRSAKLTEAAVRAATSEDGAQRTLWDVEYKGFGVRVGKTSKTFVVFRRIKGSKQPRYFTLGSYPTMTVDEARTKARHYINQIKDGTDPVYAQRQKEAEGVTFGQAWKLFRERMEARKYSARTVGRYAHYVDKYLGPWLKVPLAQFDPAWLREQHRALKRDIAAGRYALVIKRTSRRAGRRKGARVKPFNRTGEATANHVMQFAAAVYNRARKTYRTLPESPFDAIDRFEMEPRRAAIPRKQLPAWYAGVKEIPNPVRRDLLLLMLFTGLRKQSAISIKWEHVDFEHRTVFIETVKGGRTRQFYLPLSDYLFDLLQARRAENEELAKRRYVPAKSPWVFPCNTDKPSASGHIIDPREHIEGVPFIPHGLRNTFLSEAAEAGVHPYAMEALANHRSPTSTQNARYLRDVSKAIEWLREPMQRITDHLRVVIGERGSTPPDNVLPLPVRQAA